MAPARESESSDATMVVGVPAERSFASGRYIVRRVLPEGGQKTVYLVHDTALDRDCALALIRTDLLEADDLERLRREARAMARLDHPNIVAVHDIGEEDGRPFFVCQYITGGDLRGVLRAAGGPLPLARALAIAEELCAALAHAHAAGIVHRDLKPANIWLTGDGAAKLGDFGLAFALDRSRLTMAGAVVGTAAYMAPEQAMGQPADARSDLYALGCVLYEMLIGRPPFLGDDALAVISQHVNTAPVAASWHNASVPAPLDALILHLLAKAPDDRPASADTVLQELRRIEALPAGGGEADAQTAPRRELAGVEWGRFVGRRDEMDQLKSLLDGALSGQGATAMLIGEPGIGKTRLAEEFGVYARIRGARVLSGRAYEGEGGVPYRPFIEALRGYVHVRDDDALRVELGEGAPDVAALISDVRRRFPDLPESPVLEADAERLRLFESVTQFVRNASRAQPIVLVLDDLHWADKPSLSLMRHLARNSSDARVLIVGAYRDVELDLTHPLAEALAALKREQPYTRVLVRGLPESDVVEMIDALGESGEAGSPLRTLGTTLHRETEGNPLFVRELVSHLVEEGVLLREGTRWTTNATSVTDFGIPEGVRDVIGRRLARLSEGCSRMLTLASAMTGGFSWEALRAVSAGQELTLLDLLEEALAAQLMYERRDQAGTYDFTHALIRQTLYEAVSTPRRTLLHRRIGEALETLYAANVDAHLSELAQHFFQAAPGGDAQKAIDYARRAGERATALFAWEEAVAHYERALKVIDFRPTPDERLRIDLLLALADAWSSEGGNGDACKESALRAANIARQIGDRQRFARAVLSFAEPYRGDGVFDPQPVALIEEALALMGQEESGLRAMLLVQLSIALWFAGDRERPRVRSLYEEAFATARRLGDKQALVYVIAKGVGGWDASTTEEQVANAKEMLALALEAGDKTIALEAYTILVGPLLEQGDRDGADAAIEAYIELQREVRKPGWGMTWLAMQAGLDGRLADVEPLATRGYAELQKWTGNAGSGFGVQILDLRLQQGRLMELEDMTRSLADQFPGIPAYRALLGLMYADAGRLDDARAAFEEVAAGDFASVPFDRNWTITMTHLADACTLLRDVRRAGILYGLMRPYQHRCVVISAAGIAVGYAGSFHRLLGGLATTLSRWDDAERHYEAAIAVHERMRSRGWAARTQSDYAAMLLARGGSGDRERVLALLQLALDAAQEMGMQKVVEDCLALKVQAQDID